MAAVPQSEPAQTSLRKPLLLYLVSCSAGLVLVLATLMLPQPIRGHPPRAYYGKPFWFVSSDMSGHGPIPAGSGTVRWTFNPLENPTTVRGDRFVLSYGTFVLGTGVVLWLMLHVHGRRRRR
jgi:hypothetical protein